MKYYKNKEQICEELADVEIMLNQMKIIFDKDMIQSFKNLKLARLNERVEKDGI